MKVQKFKIEKKIIDELKFSLYSLASRLRALCIFIVQKNLNDLYNFNLINLYHSSVVNYIHEIENVSETDYNFIIVSKEMMEKFNSHKNILHKMEQEVSRIPFISISIH